MPWKLDSDKPIFIQIVEKMQNDILSSVYKPGERVLSVRELAIEAGVNPNTMQKALQELERRGLIYTKRTYGKYITENINNIKKVNDDVVNQTVSEFINNMRKLNITDGEILEMVKGALNTYEFIN